LQINKFNYFRSKNHLKNVASLPCQICFSEGQTQAAHSNQLIHGKGRGIKSSDEYTAALCFSCHTIVDTSNSLTKMERIGMWRTAHERTVELLNELGLWPKDVPQPR
jgi:hypothetical protein